MQLGTHASLTAELASQAQVCVAEAAQILRLPIDFNSTVPVQRRLGVVRQRLEDSLAVGSIADVCIPDACRVLTQIECLQETLSNRTMENGVVDFGTITGTVNALRGLRPAEMIAALPARICTDLPFGRAMISSVIGSIWLPQLLHIEPEVDRETDAFKAFVDGAQIHLSDAPLETELVRRRMSALVQEPAEDARTHKMIIQLSRCDAYVATPIVHRGRVIGLLHADRPSMDHLDDDDLNRLEAVSACFAVVYEQAVLRERLYRQQIRLRDSFGTTQEALVQIERADASLRELERMDSETKPVAPPNYLEAPTTRAPDPVLTGREREILDQLATGSTNKQIAQTLVISEGTVKSHVKHILRKLQSPTRAAAVAAYLGENNRQRSAAASVV